MVKYVKGNLLDASENIIGHQVNAQGVMGSGLAKQIRSKYPEAYIAYKEYSEQNSPYDLLGRCQLVTAGENKWVANLFGQLNYGRGKYRYTDYDALRTALTSLKEAAKRIDVSVALPKFIGCGLANGDWNVVSEIVEEVFEDYEVTIYEI